MNLSRSLNTDCEVQAFTDSGAPDHIKEWTNNRDIKIRFSAAKQNKSYTENGVIVIADAVIIAIYTGEFDEAHRYIIKGNTYSTLSFVNVDELDREVRIYVKREVT
jgi:hypothetical protein